MKLTGTFLDEISLLPKHQGQILMLGCGLKPNTSIHAIEELVVPLFIRATVNL